MRRFHPPRSIASAVHGRRAKQQTFSVNRLRLLWLTWRSSWSGMMILLTRLGLLRYLPVLSGSSIEGLQIPSSSSKTALRQSHPLTRPSSNWFPFGADSNVSHLSLSPLPCLSRIRRLRSSTCRPARSLSTLPVPRAPLSSIPSPLPILIITPISSASVAHPLPAVSSPWA
jgi:hypothetical protein